MNGRFDYWDVVRVKEGLDGAAAGIGGCEGRVSDKTDTDPPRYEVLLRLDGRTYELDEDDLEPTGRTLTREEVRSPEWRWYRARDELPPGQKFRFYEVVRVKEGLDGPAAEFGGCEGYIAGVTETEPLDYAVTLDSTDLGHNFSQDSLESTGRFLTREDVWGPG